MPPNEQAIKLDYYVAQSTCSRSPKRNNIAADTESEEGMTPARFQKVTYGTFLSSGHRWMGNHYNPMQIKLRKDKVPQKWMFASPAVLKNLDWLNSKQNKRNMGKLMEEENLIPTIKKLYFSYSENKNRSTYMNYLPCCIMQIFICFNKCSSTFFSPSLTFSRTVYFVMIHNH